MSPRIGSVLLGALLVGLTAGAALADIQRQFNFDVDHLTVANMIGHVDVREGPDDAFQVQVDIRGKDAAEGVLELKVSDDGDELAVVFPVADERDYVYPALGRDAHTRISYRHTTDHGGSWLRKVFGGLDGDRISVRGRGRGLEVWADVTILVPPRRTLDVKLGVGAIAAAGVQGDLNLDTHSGPVDVADLRGDLLADTGSGNVSARRVEGRVAVDTGSGGVELADCRGDQVAVDTGSGEVDAVGLRCDKLHIDTGSGGVRARSVACERATIDTGSGSVTLELDEMGAGRFVIDTGSGSIDLLLPADASARIVADTGSGAVRNEVADARVEHKERDEMRLVVGGGAADVSLDAGSGSITVSRK